MGRGEGKIATARCAIVRGTVQCSFSRKRSNFRAFLQSKFTAGSSLIFNEPKRSSDE